jgi:hypothetical protein
VYESELEYRVVKSVATGSRTIILCKTSHEMLELLSFYYLCGAFAISFGVVFNTSAVRCRFHSVHLISLHKIGDECSATKKKKEKKS